MDTVKMTVMERRIVPIFERKKSITEQVERQSDLFAHNLASELLINGISPPSWLYTPLFQSQTFDCTESKNAISGVLLQRPGPDFPIRSHNFLENKIFEPEDDAHLAKFQALSESLEPTWMSSTLLPLPDREPASSLKGLNPDSSPIKLQDKKDAVTGIVQDPTMSLARLQSSRSRSRQRDLELRKNAKSAKKLQDEKNVSPFENRGSGIAIASLRSNHEYQSELVKSSGIYKDNKEKKVVKECEQNGEGPVTRPRISPKKNTSFNMNTSSNISDEDKITDANATGEQTTKASKQLELLSSSSRPIGTNAAKTYKHKKETQKRLSKERRTDSCHGRITRSMSSRQHCHNANSLSELNNSFNTLEDDGRQTRYTDCNSSFPPPPSWSGRDADSNITLVNQSPVTFLESHKSVELCYRNGNVCLDVENSVDGGVAGSIGPLEHAGRKSGVKTLLAREEILEPDKSSCTMDHGVIESHSASFSKIIPIKLFGKFQEIRHHENRQAHTGMSNAADMARQAENNVGAEIGNYGPPNPQCVPSKSNLDATGLAFGGEVIMSRPSSDCLMSSKSEHNEFDGAVVAGSNKIGSLLPRKEIDNISLDVMDAMRYACNSSSNMILLKKQDVLAIEEEFEGYKEKTHESGKVSNGASMLIEKSPEISAVLPNLLRSVIIDSTSTDMELERAGSLEQHKMKSGVPEFQFADMQLQLGNESFEAAAKGPDSALSTAQHMWQNPISGKATPDIKKEDLQIIGRNFIDGNNKEYNMNSAHSFPSSKALVTQENDLKSYVEEMHPNNGYIVERSESSPVLQVIKDGTILEIQDGLNTSINEQIMSPTFGLVTKAGGDSHCLEAEEGVMNPICRVFDAGKQCVIQQNQDLLQINEELALKDSEKLICAGRNIRGKRHYLEENHQFSYNSVGHSHTQSSDQTMPIFESFQVESDDEQLRVVTESINFEKFNLSHSTLERVSCLEQLCKSVSINTPLSSSKPYKLHTTMSYIQSVPGWLLESMDVESSDSMSQTMKSIKGSSFYNQNVTLNSDGSSCSDNPINSNDQFASDLRKFYVSPVGKLWDRITSDSIISEKSGSLNSELPSIKEENENAARVTDILSEAIDEDMMTQSVQRIQLAKITETPLSMALVSEAEMCTDKYSKQTMKEHCNEKNSMFPYTSNIKEEHSITLGGNGVKSIRFSKPKLSGKIKLNQRQRISEKENKLSNIVANITSFIPLVQKKQAGTAAKGKRDIKVKALDAAGAAKRLAEKKEMERKMKKEAMKLERERMELENLKQLEMQKKKKDEEQKKKEADMAAKKRQREEEGKKEKERKKLKTEEMRKRQRECNERSIAKKETKYQPKDQKAQSDNIMEISEPQRKINAASIVDLPKPNTIPCNETKGPSNVNHSTEDLNFDSSQHISYDISPYKCSDDEQDDDDDDDNYRDSKFIPSWASKNYLARVADLQSTINPELIFFPKRSSSMDEVLPRNSRNK